MISAAKLHDHPARWALEKYESGAIQKELAGVYAQFLPEFEEDSRYADGTASLVRFKLVRTEMGCRGRLVSENHFVCVCVASSFLPNTFNPKQLNIFLLTIISGVACGSLDR